jgi:hypothetical protein
VKVGTKVTLKALDDAPEYTEYFGKNGVVSYIDKGAEFPIEVMFPDGVGIAVTEEEVE